MKFKNLFLTLLLASGASMQASDYAIKISGADNKLVMAPGKCTFSATVFADQPASSFEFTTELRGIQANKYKVEKKMTVKTENRTCIPLKFDFDVSSPGLYELAVELRHPEAEGLPAARSATYCLIAPPAAPVADLGVQTHLGKWRNMELLLDLVQYAGFSRIRDEMYWSSVERQPGTFVFPDRIDQMIKLAGKRGIKPLIILNYGNHVAYPELFPKGRSFPSNDNMHKLFLAYVEQCVKRYGHTVKSWELWNEPNNVKPGKVYLPLLTKVFATIKKLDSSATVISCGGGGAGGGPGGAYISPIIKAGGVDFQDAFSIHPYMSPADPDRGYGPCKGSPVTFVNVPSVWAFLGKLCEKNRRSDGKNLRFWITEVGWPTGDGRNTVSELDQAAYLTRLLLQHRRSGKAEALFIYDLLSDGVRHGEAEHNFGILRPDFSPKASFAGIAAFMRVIGNKKHTSDISDDKIKAFRYGDVIALYALEKSPQYVLNLPEAKTAEVVQWDGYAVNRPVKDGKLKLRLSKLPVYVRVLK